MLHHAPVPQQPLVSPSLCICFIPALQSQFLCWFLHYDTRGPAALVCQGTSSGPHSAEPFRTVSQFKLQSKYTCSLHNKYIGSSLIFVQMLIPPPLDVWLWPWYLEQRNKFPLHWTAVRIKCKCIGTSPVVQWLRIRLPMQGTQVRSLVWEDPTCHGTTKPASHNYWAYTLEPKRHNYWSPCA